MRMSVLDTLPNNVITWEYHDYPGYKGIERYLFQAQGISMTKDRERYL